MLENDQRVRRKVVDLSPPEGQYATSDLYFAAFIAARGNALLTTIPGVRCQFVFAAPPDLDDLRFSWTNGSNDEVSATRFAEKVRQLKALAMQRS